MDFPSAISTTTTSAWVLAPRAMRKLPLIGQASLRTSRVFVIAQPTTNALSSHVGLEGPRGIDVDFAAFAVAQGKLRHAAEIESKSEVAVENDGLIVVLDGALVFQLAGIREG